MIGTTGTLTSEIPAALHPSGFEKSDSNFYSLMCASDGNLYYTLCTHDVDTNAQSYRYAPATGEVKHLGDFGAITGSLGQKVIPQGKSHAQYLEMDGVLYLATHFGFYAPDMADGSERPGTPPPGYGPYPGGYILAYDMAGETFTVLARAPASEGIITFGVDRRRRRFYGLSWPSGLLLSYGLGDDEMRHHGKVSRDGELGQGDQYFCLCRSFAIVPDSGVLYLTNANGEIVRYDPEADRIDILPHESLKRDILGHWDPHQPGHQGYNWRVTIWHEKRQVFYGVHPRSGYLFTFDPATERIELVERICAADNRRNGNFEPFRYGYLSLAFGHDQEVLYYLTCTDGFTADDGRRVKSAAHLITYELQSGAYRDHGALRLPDGRYIANPQTLAVGPDGRIYSCPRIESPGSPTDDLRHSHVDLISFPDPLA